ncbi:TPA: hypothetical protein MYN70_003101 [Klebsiella pneumoniae]|nr:hypothetical protein [Klebsiella pneumoniae]
MLTSKEKAWFFLTGGYQPKINKLIFLVIFLVQSASTMIAWGLSGISRPA